jgi:hypothetical protein
VFSREPGRALRRAQLPLTSGRAACAGARQASHSASYDLLQTVRESASRLRASLLDSLARQREQREMSWEQDRREWLENVQQIDDNWRSELSREIQRTRDIISTDIFLSLPCSHTVFPGAGEQMIVHTLKARAEPLGPLKAAALASNDDVCAVCLDLLSAGERVIALPRCHHIFHWVCLRPWLEKKGEEADCPCCKRSICPELTLDETKWAVSVVERQMAREALRQRERARARESEAEEGVLAHLYRANERTPTRAEPRSYAASGTPSMPTQGHASTQSHELLAESRDGRDSHAAASGGAQNPDVSHTVPRTEGVEENGGAVEAGSEARHARGLRQLYVARAGKFAFEKLIAGYTIPPVGVCKVPASKSGEERGGLREKKQGRTRPDVRAWFLAVSACFTLCFLNVSVQLLLTCHTGINLLPPLLPLQPRCTTHSCNKATRNGKSDANHSSTSLASPRRYAGYRLGPVISGGTPAATSGGDTLCAGKHAGGSAAHAWRHGAAPQHAPSLSEKHTCKRPNWLLKSGAMDRGVMWGYINVLTLLSFLESESVCYPSACRTVLQAGERFTSAVFFILWVVQ